MKWCFFGVFFFFFFFCRKYVSYPRWHGQNFNGVYFNFWQYYSTAITSTLCQLASLIFKEFVCLAQETFMIVVCDINETSLILEVCSFSCPEFTRHRTKQNECFFVLLPFSTTLIGEMVTGYLASLLVKNSSIS